MHDRLRRSVVAGSVVLLMGSLAQGQVLEHMRFLDPELPSVPVAEAQHLVRKLPRAEAPPMIDGELTDACWKLPGAYLGAFRLGLSPTPARHSRQAWATYDGEHLYFGVRLQREPGAELRAMVAEPDDPQIWEDDEVEVFLDPFGSGTTYYQLIINSLGNLYDAFHSLSIVPDPGGASPADTMLERATDPGWSAVLECKVAIHEEYWSIEAALPLTSVGLTGAPAGHEVRFNITSADWDTGEYTCLSPVSSWHDPLQFGALILGDPRVEVTALGMGQVGMGECRLSASVGDLSGAAGEYRLGLSLRTDKGRTAVERGFALEAGGRASVRIPFQVEAAAGPWEADVRIVDAQGACVYAARRSGTVQPPLKLRLGSQAAFSDGPPVLAAASVGLGGITARRVTLLAELLDARGRVASRQELGSAQAPRMTAWLPVAGLTPGAYRLRLTAMQDGRAVASAEDSLLVGISPFAGR